MGKSMNGPRVELVAFDMEGVLTTDPTVWELMHRKLGTWESHGRPYWERYLAGEFHYDEFARMDVAVWEGAEESLLREAAAEVPLMPGCRHVLDRLRRAGVKLAIISNGLTHMARRFSEEFGVEHVHANRALVGSGRLTGGVEVAVPYEAKGRMLRRLAHEHRIARERTAAVGDGAADVAMFRESGLSVAVRPRREAVARAATHVLRDSNLTPLADILLEPCS